MTSSGREVLKSQKTPRSTKSRPKSGPWYSNALTLAGRILATLSVLIMAALFYPQLLNLGAQAPNDLIALALIPILLSVFYLISWKKLVLGATGALFVFLAFLTFMYLKNLSETLPLEALLSINAPTAVLLLAAVVQKLSYHA